MNNFNTYIGIISGVFSIVLALLAIADRKSINKRGLLIITIALIIIIGAGVFFSTSTTIIPHPPRNPFVSNATEPPTATSIPTATPSPTPTPKVIPENINIPCLSCQGGNYALTLKLNTITIDYANQQTIMKYTLTNIGTVSCTVIFDKLEFQDDNGTIFKAQNAGQSIVDIAVTNSFIASSTFDLVPRPNTHYLLTTSIVCTNRIDFQNQDFVFN